MKSTSTLLTAALAAIMVAPVANADNYEGYAESANGSVVRNAYGECWQSGASYSKDKMILGCGAKDSDGDGVIDSKDKCPGTPKGVKVDATGCPLDADGDGVMDDKDACPTTPAGRTVNSLGCQLDGDNDGVYDADDACPNTPSGHSVNAAGCSSVKVTVYFDSAKSDLTASAMAKLKAAAAALGDKGITSVTASGAADPRGGADYNQQLSMKRAAAVKAYLSGNGVTAGKIATDARGEINTGTMSQDRRVDVTGMPSGQ